MSHRDVSSVARVHMFTLGIDSQPHRVMQYGVREGPKESPEEDMSRLWTQALAKRSHRRTAGASAITS